MFNLRASSDFGSMLSVPIHVGIIINHTLVVAALPLASLRHTILHIATAGKKGRCSIVHDCSSLFKLKYCASYHLPDVLFHDISVAGVCWRIQREGRFCGRDP